MTVYAGFWMRVAAYLIDAIILAVVGGIVGAAIGAGTVLSLERGESALMGAQLVSMGINALIGWAYYAVMESSDKQATVGKLALGIVVTDESGNRIDFGRATGRHFAKIISGLILGFGYFMIGWTERKQGLHDIIAGTLVVRKNSMVGTNSATVFD